MNTINQQDLGIRGGHYQGTGGGIGLPGVGEGIGLPMEGRGDWITRGRVGGLDYQGWEGGLDYQGMGGGGVDLQIVREPSRTYLTQCHQSQVQK